jgi:hypothetical protein
MPGDETVAGVAGIGPILILFLHGGPDRKVRNKCRGWGIGSGFCQGKDVIVASISQITPDGS